MDNKTDQLCDRVKIYSYLVTGGTGYYDSIKENIPDVYDAYPAYGYDTDKKISKTNRDRIRDILADELKESYVLRKIRDVSEEDILKETPVAIPRTDKVYIGDAYIYEDAVITNIHVDRIEKVKPN